MPADNRVPEVDFASVTPELLQRYDRPGPRYTSYPTAPQFHTGFTADDYEAALARASERVGDPLSLYVHIPFCEARCSYCGCSVVISPHRGPEERYLEAIEGELAMVAGRLGARRTLNQLHWGAARRRSSPRTRRAGSSAPSAGTSGSRPAPRWPSRSIPA